MGLPEPAIIGVGREREPVVRLPGAVGLQEGKLQVRVLRPCVDAGPALIEQLQRGRGRRAEMIVRPRERDVKLGLITFRAQVDIHSAQLRGRGEVAPARVVRGIRRDVGRIIPVLVPGLRGRRDAAVGAAHQLRLGPLIVESVLHIDRQSAADRVEPEHRVVGLHGHPGDGHFGNEIPIDDITIRFVDAGAVLVHRDALRRPRHRRGCKAPVIQIALELVARLIAQVNAGHRLEDRSKQVRRFRMIEVRSNDRLDVRRHLISIDLASRHRRYADNLDGRQLLLRASPRRRHHTSR